MTVEQCQLCRHGALIERYWTNAQKCKAILEPTHQNVGLIIERGCRALAGTP